jgi:metallophosphoesterase (TIGR00282 family)
LKVLFVGDIVGGSGIKLFKSKFAAMKSVYGFDFCIVNGENATAGSGITGSTAKDLHAAGADIITTGNHIWSKKDILTYIDSDPYLTRPANLHPSVPGKGVSLFTRNGMTLGVLNLIGRIFMDPSESPFLAADKEVAELRKVTKAVIVDIHAEATSEKAVMGRYLDGRVSAVLGTHTHVQTADEKILPRGTAFMTDVGMTGPYDSIIGVDIDTATDRLVKNLSERMLPAEGRSFLNAVLLEIDEITGKCVGITRIKEMGEDNDTI